jgi:hypothetical protein
MYSAIPVSAAFGYLLGLRFVALFFFIAALWVPLGALLAAGLGIIATPRLEEHYPAPLDLNARI